MPTPDPSMSLDPWQTYIAARDAFVSSVVVPGLIVGLALVVAAVWALVIIAGGRRHV